MIEDSARGQRNILHSAKRLLDIFGSSSRLKSLKNTLQGTANTIQDKEAGRAITIQLRSVCEKLNTYVRFASGDRFLGSTIASTRNCFFQIADDAVAETLFFGVEPGWEEKRMLDFGDAVKTNKANLDVFVYSPSLSASDSTLIGRALKADYFASVRNDPVRK